MKKLFLTLFTLLSIFTIAGCNKEIQFDETKGTHVVGLECDYPPFNWLETKAFATNYPVDNIPGSYAERYDVQMAKKIADNLGYKLVIKKITWEDLIEALKSGNIDLIIAGMSPTEDRKLSINSVMHIMKQDMLY